MTFIEEKAVQFIYCEKNDHNASHRFFFCHIWTQIPKAIIERLNPKMCKRAHVQKNEMAHDFYLFQALAWRSCVLLCVYPCVNQSAANLTYFQTHQPNIFSAHLGLYVQEPFMIAVIHSF